MPRFNVRLGVTFQSSWKYRLWINEPGSQAASSRVYCAWLTEPRRKPAKSFPVRGTVLPLGWRPAVMPANEKLPLGLPVCVLFSRLSSISYPILKAWDPDNFDKSSRQDNGS